MTVYNGKNIKQWESIVNDEMPMGFLWSNVGNKSSVIGIILYAIALIFKQRDNDFANKFNSLKMTIDSQFLDDYWEMFGINNYLLEKPTDLERKFKIINSFAKAHSNDLSTTKQIQDFIYNVFDFEIFIYLYNVNVDLLTEDIPQYIKDFLLENPQDDNTVIVGIPTGNKYEDENTLTTKKIPFKLINRERYIETIKNLIEIIIDVDFKIVFVEET